MSSASPRHILHHQSREGFISPGSSSSLRRCVRPPLTFQTGSVPQLSVPSGGVPPNYAQVLGPPNTYIVGPPGHAYQQTPLPGPMPVSMCNQMPVYPMPPPPPPPVQAGFQVPEGLQRTGVQLHPQPSASYNNRVIASVGRPQGSIRLVQSDSGVVQDHLIRARNAASSVRTTWQQQQRQQYQPQLYPMAPPTFTRPNTLASAAIPPTILQSAPGHPR